MILSLDRGKCNAIIPGKFINGFRLFFGADLSWTSDRISGNAMQVAYQPNPFPSHFNRALRALRGTWNTSLTQFKWKSGSWLGNKYLWVYRINFSVHVVGLCTSASAIRDMNLSFYAESMGASVDHQRAPCVGRAYSKGHSASKRDMCCFNLGALRGLSESHLHTQHLNGNGTCIRSKQNTDSELEQQ